MNEIIGRCVEAMRKEVTGFVRADACERMLVAALLVLRTPTEAMIDAADEICPIARGTESHKMSGGKVPEDYWRVMIDAALGKPPACDECGVNLADPPSKLCPGCQAYREHRA